MEHQTTIAATGYILLVIGMAFIMGAMGAPGSAVLVNSLTSSFGYIVALYALNCAVLGKCILYANIVAYLVLIAGIIIFILGLFSFMAKPKFITEMSPSARAALYQK